MSPVLFEPAEAYAAARCLASRSYHERTTARHSRRCGWCDYPTETLDAMVTGFNQWADFSEKHGTSGRGDVRAFQALPSERQEELIVEAQAFEPEAAGIPQGGSDPRLEAADKDRLAAVSDVGQVQTSRGSFGTSTPVDAPEPIVAWLEDLP
jgi:hypothetical protein